MYQTWIGFFFWVALLCLPVVAVAQGESLEGQPASTAGQEVPDNEQNEAFRKCVLGGGSWKDCSDKLGAEDVIKEWNEKASFLADAASRPWGGIWSPSAGELILKNRGR